MKKETVRVKRFFIKSTDDYSQIKTPENAEEIEIETNITKKMKNVNDEITDLSGLKKQYSGNI